MHRGQDHQFVLDFPADHAAPAQLPPDIGRAIGREPIATFRGRSDSLLVFDTEETVASLGPDFSALVSAPCVALPLHLRGWPRKKAHARATEVLNLVQLGDRIEHLPDELSGGQRQRVAIARALAVYPPILLADEPTGNLDSASGAAILELIPGLQRHLQTTVLIVTHDAGVADACPRVVALRDGSIVEDRRR